MPKGDELFNSYRELESDKDKPLCIEICIFPLSLSTACLTLSKYLQYCENMSTTSFNFNDGERN